MFKFQVENCKSANEHLCQRLNSQTDGGNISEEIEEVTGYPEEYLTHDEVLHPLVSFYFALYAPEQILGLQV